jgi:hypothetical protein
MATSSTPITSVNAGDTVYGEIVADPNQAGTFTVISTVNGQTTTLSAVLGSGYNANLAETCIETYAVTSCSQLPCQATTFSDLVLVTSNGVVDPVPWTANEYITQVSSPNDEPICNGTAVAVGDTDTQIGFDCQA